MPFARILLGLAAAIFGIGGVLHALAYHTSASSRLDGAHMPAFFAGELRVLWLADSSTLLALAVLFGFLAMRPTAATRPLLFLLAMVPLGTTSLLYVFLGGFYAAHLLAAASLMVIAAAFLNPRPAHGAAA